MLIVISVLSQTEAKLYLFANSNEVQTLLGLKTEIFYIKDGMVNNYALSFALTVPAHISVNRFSWNTSLPAVAYQLAVRVSDTEAMDQPKINISNMGYVPMQTQVFSVSLVCTGRTSAEVDIEMEFNINVGVFVPPIQMILKRKKICKKSDVKLTTTDAPVSKIKTLEPPVYSSGSAIYESTNPLSIALTCASAIILLVALSALLCYFCYVRPQKDRQTENPDLEASLTNLSSAKSGQAFLRGETPSHLAISKTGSHYSSFRGFLNAPPLERTSLYRTLSVPTGMQNEHKRGAKLNQNVCELTVERRKILLQQKLCEGTFGRLYSALYVSNYNDVTAETKVLVKTVSDQASKHQISLVMTEGMRFYGLTHRNLMSITGTSADDPHRPLLIYPNMSNGILKLFLQKSSAHKNGSYEGQIQTFLTQDLVQMALQIASAVIYLHKRRIIHRDLATRNCFVTTADDNSFLVKVADNALSRDLFPNDYHCLGDNENRPIKWMALESLVRKEFSTGSDVWSFGVTLWELMTLGQQPYFEVDPFEIADYLRDGYRLFQPINCPDKLYEVMVCCWNAIPEARPSFSQLLSCLNDFHQTLGKYI